MPPIYQAGRRVHTPDATYTLPDENAANEALDRFLYAQRTEDDAVAKLRRYNAHLETMLAGATYGPPTRAFIDQIDAGVHEVPKTPARR